MSPKELMYIEDVLGHEKQMKTACDGFSQSLQDSELKNFVSGLAAKHQDCFTKFLALLNN